MYKLFVIFALSATTVFGQETVTFQTSIGKDAVKRIIREETEMLTKESANNFLLNPETLAQLTAKLPSGTVSRLSLMVGKEIRGWESFNQELRYYLNDEEVYRYGNTISTAANTIIVIEGEFLDQVQSLVLKTKVLTVENPTTRLRLGFRAFLFNYVAMAKRDPNAKRAENVVFIGFHPEQWRVYTAGRCGEIPCSDCCGEACYGVCKSKTKIN
ncbi:MAG TPA: hypothetical protein VGO50_18090 [Pyrinomonadaceae bacterium]|jgi:hypothetical protein|nr:hypothetical protein [Pyrinomonadaceae bacterium]